MFGTGFYAAPEIYLDQFTPKADIYSLAISIVQVSVDAGELLTVEDWAMVKHNEQLPIRAAKGEWTRCFNSSGFQLQILAMLISHSVELSDLQEIL